mmetsp:Transcript_25656/g.44194  ORF Transcript_25656/g.44194 Transcript_25656/m.44194 type:complete len:193 (+) Transcript_25656:115-693(+)|eukprot:CAMPEP_0196659198 /NCGR_PEP_ID=MMETSP1086-20130531/33632_1 /TAXON_ID=77921 /ORGANISM="Cyanoptyche  gloeocystis , Strain SAG4.97" /LENGTH=192 /DNA_ID=CAMNT_0041993075 /DNA_START=111 /DNA_END=689 /DNA_ORIENTATION=+
MLSDKSAVISEAGNAWFMGQKLKLPEGCRFESQMLYASIGWSVGAVMGTCLAYSRGSEKRRVIGLIGDGSFQMSAQEVSTMIRNKLDPIIFVLNNRGYGIEVKLHDGPYNDIQNWDYKELVDSFANGDPDVYTARVQNLDELDAAVQKSLAHPGLCFIECLMTRGECLEELPEWGTRFGANTGRPAAFESIL